MFNLAKNLLQLFFIAFYDLLNQANKMLYPHEKEERKALLGELIDQPYKNLKEEGVSLFSIGIISILTALIDSFLLHSSIVSWKMTWVAVCSFTAFALLTKTLLTRGSKKKQQALFFLKIMFPIQLTGIVIAVLQSSFIEAACLWLIFYALSRLSVSFYQLPRYRYLALAVLFFAFSCYIVSQRHDLSSLDARHLANIILLIGCGFPHFIVGSWNLFFGIKYHIT